MLVAMSSLPQLCVSASLSLTLRLRFRFHIGHPASVRPPTSSAARRDIFVETKPQNHLQPRQGRHIPMPLLTELEHLSLPVQQRSRTYGAAVNYRFVRARRVSLPYCGASSPNQYAAVTPPSMRKSLPVINAPSGPIRSAPTVPTSSGVPARPAGDTSIMRR
jgi:hypothetical protein